MIPEKLGPYRLGRRLGRGGMGSVYEGIDEATDERVAVKVLSADFSHERDFRERFASEIETLRRLRHPHIVRLFGFGQEEGQLYYAMELVDGVSLEEELQQGRVFRWQEVLRIGQQTCDALRHAHDRGVIHRDIKPANLLLAADESVKLSDFGIAKMFGHGQLTAVGSVIGTVEYMAPEQADARPLDARADLYSLGGVLYALLAGRAPLIAQTLPEMLRKQREEMPEPLERFVTGVPREVSQLIQQLLEKDPDRRVANARLLARRLDVISMALVRNKVDSEQESGEGESSSIDNDEFELRRPVPSVGDDPLGMMPTRAMDDEDDLPAAPSPSHEGPLPETLATDAFQLTDLPEGEGSETEESEEAIAPVTHFTPVAEEELDQAPVAEEPPHPLFSWQTGILVASLVALGLTILYLLQPPTADALYGKVMAAAADGEVASIKDVEGEIADFLARYSDDPRCGRLRELQREVELDRLETRFNLRVRRMHDADGLLPIQKAYLEARAYLWLDPEKGAAKLRAMIALYGQKSGVSEPTAQVLDLAKARLAKFEKEKERLDKDYFELVQSRLEKADALAESDQERARAMYEAVIELYSTKPWAADAVRHAREAIEGLKQ